MTILYAEDDATQLAEMTVRGTITHDDYVAAVTPLQSFIDRHGTIRFIEVIESFAGFDPSILLPGLRFDWQNIRHISHVAVVSDLGWISPLTRAAGAFLSCKVRFFPLADIDAARDWARSADRS